MKKNIYLIIITIITVVCIIAGSLYHIGGFALGLFDTCFLPSDGEVRSCRVRSTSPKQSISLWVTSS